MSKENPNKLMSLIWDKEKKHESIVARIENTTREISKLENSKTELQKKLYDIDIFFIFYSILILFGFLSVFVIFNIISVSYNPFLIDLSSKGHSDLLGLSLMFLAVSTLLLMFKNVAMQGGFKSNLLELFNSLSCAFKEFKKSGLHNPYKIEKNNLLNKYINLNEELRLIEKEQRIMAIDLRKNNEFQIYIEKNIENVNKRKADLLNFCRS